MFGPMQACGRPTSSGTDETAVLGKSAVGERHLRGLRPMLAEAPTAWQMHTLGVHE